jgi:hypothetical protein
LSENPDVGQQQRCNTNEFTHGHGNLKIVRVMADGQQRTNAARDPDESQHGGESPDFSAGPPASPVPDEERGGKYEGENDEPEDGNAVTVGHSAHCCATEIADAEEQTGNLIAGRKVVGCGSERIKGWRRLI